MNIGLFEDDGWRRLLPLTWLRATFELCCGRDRLIDKIAASAGRVRRFWTRDLLTDVLAERFDLSAPNADDAWTLINGRCLLTEAFAAPPLGTAWVADGELVAVTVTAEMADRLESATLLNPRRCAEWLAPYKQIAPPEGLRLIRYPWELALSNADELRRQCVDGGVLDGKIYPGAHLLDDKSIHVARGAVVKPGVVLDAEDGPVWIDEDALVEPNAVLQGPCYVGRGSIVRPGAIVREGVTIGPVCRVGGEIEASILHGHANKQHDGFLGHSYVAPWVNLGADTITSDLKNTYGTIRVFISGAGVESGQRFIGSIIGDHAKTGIGTILPTGCVVGVASNVFTQSSTPKFVPSFAWLTDAGMTEYHLDKAISIARVVMGRRKVDLSDAEARLLERVHDDAETVERGGWD